MYVVYRCIGTALGGIEAGNEHDPHQLAALQGYQKRCGCKPALVERLQKASAHKTRLEKLCSTI